MISRLCRCGILVGALLIVLAVLLVLQVDGPRGAAQDAQRARLVSTLAQLEACQTCHAAAPQAVQLVAPDRTVDYLRAVTLVEDATPSHPTPLSMEDGPSALRAELVSVGQRLLELPAGNAARVQAVTTAYLEIAEAVLAQPVLAEPGSLLAALQAIALSVRELEYGAAPEQWCAAQVQRSVSDVGAALALPTGPFPVVWMGLGVVLLLALSCLGPAHCRGYARLPWEIVYAVRRRGPPLAAHLACCLRRRLACRTRVCAQSSFLCV